MLFQWEKYLELARVLAGDQKEEKLRSAISRAYYYAFHMSQSFSESQGTTINRNTVRNSVHMEVIKFLKEFGRKHSNQRIQKAGQTLGKLKDKRDSADYDDVFEKNDLEASTQFALVMAENIMKDLQSYIP